MNAVELLENTVRRLGELARSGRPVAMLWDMDGTLVDTRPRMLAAVHAYGRTDVRLTEVTPSWQETADRLRLDSARFREVWHRVFWAYESFDADRENVEVARLARLAESLGIQTIIITGRVEELRPVTARQLDRLGLQPTRVFLKSRVGDRTPSVKAEVIRQLAAEGLCIGAFVTDSVDELHAVTPEILASAPELELVFVELEGFPVELDPSIHRFPVPFRNGADMADRLDHLSVGQGRLQFGFEAEYEISSSDALLRLYDPTEQAGLSAADWHSWTCDQRQGWVNSQFPNPHSEEFDLPLRRNERESTLDFLPPGLFVDSDGNIEVVSQPVEDLALLWDQLERLEEACGTPLLQVTVSAPSAPHLSNEKGLRALDGYLAFHHLHDILERMAVGHQLYLENPERDVLPLFSHPWLGPMTAGKERFLRQYLDANAKGERLDEKWVRLVDRAFSSFKYISGSAYRPALAGPDRVAFEIRDAHRNKALLGARVRRHAVSLLGDLEPYAAFAKTYAFDSESDYQRLPEEVQEMLERLFPSRERPEIDEMYSAYDRVALQVYRNFALPMKDHSDVERALADGATDPALGNAQRTYLDRLRQLVRSDQDSSTLRRQVQGALAAFAVESRLLERLQRFGQRHLTSTSARAAERRVHAFLPLLSALPPSAWSGSLEQRLKRLKDRWPENVLLKTEGHVRLLLSISGLDAQTAERLRTDYLNAVSLRTLGLRSDDRGGLQLRYGQSVLLPGQSSERCEAYQPFSEGSGPEIVLQLDGAEGYRVGRQLAAHSPNEQAARRVSASGWLRHLRLGPEGEYLESVLGLPRPESIETARQVWGRVLGCSPKGRVGCVVQWTDEPLGLEFLAPLDAASSALESGFPPTLGSDLPLRERLKQLVEAWPDHARLVNAVPFEFGQGSQQRTVLVLAPGELDDESWERFGHAYLQAVGADTISFPCRLRAEHLRTRLGTLALALSAEGVRVDFYEPPWKRRRMEALIELEEAEVDRLRRYLGAVVDDTLGVLGPITLGAGCRRTEGRHDSNRPTDGGEHNCTTWVTLAPIGDQGESLASLTAMPERWHSHDNPGWWSMFLTGASRSAKVHTVVYWSDLPLEEDPTASGVAIPWDFNPH